MKNNELLGTALEQIIIAAVQNINWRSGDEGVISLAVGARRGLAHLGDDGAQLWMAVIVRIARAAGGHL